MEMSKDSDCRILFSYRRKTMEMMISQNCIRILKNADHIAFIINPDRLILGIVVPEDPKIGIKISKFRIRGDYLCIKSVIFGVFLMDNLKLIDNADYQVPGYYSKESNCILFPLHEMTFALS